MRIMIEQGSNQEGDKELGKNLEGAVFLLLGKEF